MSGYWTWGSPPDSDSRGATHRPASVMALTVRLRGPSVTGWPWPVPARRLLRLPRTPRSRPRTRRYRCGESPARARRPSAAGCTARPSTAYEIVVSFLGSFPARARGLCHGPDRTILYSEPEYYQTGAAPAACALARGLEMPDVVVAGTGGGRPGGRAAGQRPSPPSPCWSATGRASGGPGSGLDRLAAAGGQPVPAASLLPAPVPGHHRGRAPRSGRGARPGRGAALQPRPGCARRRCPQAAVRGMKRSPPSPRRPVVESVLARVAADAPGIAVRRGARLPAWSPGPRRRRARATSPASACRTGLSCEPTSW